MFRRSAFPAAIAALVAASSCRHAALPSGVDPAMASCVSADTALLAGLDLAHLRNSPIYASLHLSALDAFRDSDYLLAASNGRESLLVLRGKFAEAPAGGTLVAPHLAVAGAPDMVRSAIAQHRAGRAGAADLLARAAAVANGSQIWAVSRGGIALPLTGNAANLNRLFRDSVYATLAAKLDRRVDIEIVSQCRNPESARQFEETLRAFLSLAGRFQSVEVRRDDAVVHAAFSADAETLGKLLPR